jgi:hypothetical protein
MALSSLMIHAMHPEAFMQSNRKIAPLQAMQQDW